MSQNQNCLQGSTALRENHDSHHDEVSRSINKITTGSKAFHSVECYIPTEAILKCYENLIDEFVESLTKMLWIECENVYYIPKYELIVQKANDYPNSGYQKTLMVYSTQCFTTEQAKYLFYTNKNQLPTTIITAINNSKKYNGNSYISCDNNNRALSMESGTICDWGSGDGDKIRIHSASLTIKKFIHKLLKQDFRVLISDNSNSKLIKIFNLMKENSITEAIPPFTQDERIDAFRSLYVQPDLVEKLSELLPVENEINNITMNQIMLDSLITNVLSADQQRADLEPDDRKCVEDINLGHWELWGADSAGGEDIPLGRELVARNPVADIRRNGIVGIDFGTKSTIVSCQDGNDYTTLLRIGMGELSKKPEPSHYENPTVLEFVDLESFLNDFNTEDGRPHTRFADLYVSHRAANNLKDSSDSGRFYSYFYDIKQWCGSSDRYQQIKIIDQQGKVRVLPKYLDVNPSFDPVEIYAYYLGLYINNMRNGIYMKYILSFPAMYSKAVREKMLGSFRLGLKKSLPKSVLDDENAMKEFSVISGISEPEAYAITALQNYGFTPEGDDKIYYGIFDFGGGTTDFDFGIWREADGEKRDEESYDYVITHLENGGDKYLGGENLLERMAFEVFKANEDKLRQNSNVSGYSFCIPVGVQKPAGMETLISESQEARRNTKALMEALRPFWEGLTAMQGENRQESSSNILHSRLTSDSYLLNPDCKIIEQGFVTVRLFDKNGESKADFRLDIVNKDKEIDVDLLGILEREIDRGVRNFFEALRPLFDNKNTGMDKAEQIQIFIAGNSGKSPILSSLFKKYISEYTEKIRQIQENPSDNGCFIIYPSLGTPEARAIQLERGITADEETVISPTGKTGVAYGLIEGRSGGRIKVISDQTKDKEAKFKYYLGIARKGKFVCKTDRNIQYNEWHRFGNAGNETFELYYSSLPESTSNKVVSAQISKVRLQIDIVDINADVFIRAVSPTEIEYVVAHPNNVKNGSYLNEPRKMELI